MVLVHSAPTREDVIFGDQLRDWAQVGRLRLVERHTETAGILDPAYLDHVVPDWRDREAWACGPIGLLDAMEAHWATPAWPSGFTLSASGQPSSPRGKGAPSPSCAKALSSRPMAPRLFSTPVRRPVS